MKKRSKSAKTDGQVLMDHIRELRTRLAVCAVVLIVGGVVGYIFYTPILDWLRSPLQANLYYSTPAGSFNFIIKVSTMVGVFATVPLLIFQIIKFIQPVFKTKLSNGRVFGYTIASIFLAIAGGLFAFFAILPGALRFFAGFQVAGLSALIDANNYLNFVTNAIVTFIIVFQIPLIMIIIDRIKPISPKKLLSFEKFVVIGGLVVSLVVPFSMDLSTSLLIASPIVILYNLSLLMIFIRHAALKRKKAPILQPVTSKEIVIDDELIGEFFAMQSEKIDAVEAFAVAEVRQKVSPVKPVHVADPQSMRLTRPAQPLQAKPRPGRHDVDVLRAQARAKRDQEIAARVAAYNNPSFRVINDIR